MSRFAALDLSRVAVPDVVEPLDFEGIVAELKADFLARFPAFNVSALESDPVIKVMEVAAARELALRGRVNDAARAVMLARAGRADLDNLAALYKTRRLIVGHDANEQPIYESDEDFRRRVSLAPEAFSSAGPRGAYIYFALTGDSETRIATDADCIMTEPGHVTVPVMGAAGVPTADEVAAVRDALSGEGRLPMTDVVTVLAATAASFDVNGVLTIEKGPDPSLMKARSEAAITALAAGQRKLSGEILRSAVIKAGFVDGAVDFDVEFDDITASFGVFPDLNNLNVEVIVR